MNYLNQGIKTLAAASSLALTSITLAGNAVAVETLGGLELLDRIGEYPPSMYTFYAATPSAAELENTLGLAKTLGKGSDVVFDKETLLTDKTRLGLGSSTDPSASFEVDTVTGNFLFNGGMAGYRKESNTAGLPTAEEAISLSGKVLESLRPGLDPSEMKPAHVGGLNMAVTQGKGDSSIFEKLKTVRYSRVLEGLPVAGDARLVVHFGENGTTEGVIYQWPKIAKKTLLGSSDLQSPSTIRKLALERIGAVVGKALKAELTQVELVLYDDAKGVMEPAYHLVVERYFDYDQREPTMIPYNFYIPTTLKPAAFYPYMDKASVQPADGTDTGKVENSNDD